MMDMVVDMVVLALVVVVVVVVGGGGGGGVFSPAPTGTGPESDVRCNATNHDRPPQR